MTGYSEIAHIAEDHLSPGHWLTSGLIENGTVRQAAGVGHLATSRTFITIHY